MSRSTEHRKCSASGAFVYWGHILVVHDFFVIMYKKNWRKLKYSDHAGDKKGFLEKLFVIILWSFFHQWFEEI